MEKIKEPVISMDQLEWMKKTVFKLCNEGKINESFMFGFLAASCWLATDVEDFPNLKKYVKQSFKQFNKYNELVSSLNGVDFSKGFQDGWEDGEREARESINHRIAVVIGPKTEGR